MMFKKEDGTGTALTLNRIMFFVSLFFIIFKGISMDKNVWHHFLDRFLQKKLQKGLKSGL